ncbi:MAG: energy transducer TonB [Saprospiraceae bacterium]|nr:energy transducer TonB [Saprospiraceae bacterium]
MGYAYEQSIHHPNKMKTVMIQFIVFSLTFTSIFAQLPDQLPASQAVVITTENDRPLLSRPAFYPGGNKALLQFVTETMEYPEIGQEYGMEGTIVVRFTVNKVGEINNIVIEEGLNKVFDEAVIDMIKQMPAWIPAMEKGILANYEYRLPLRFSLH